MKNVQSIPNKPFNLGNMRTSHRCVKVEQKLNLSMIRIKVPTVSICPRLCTVPTCPGHWSHWSPWSSAPARLFCQASFSTEPDSAPRRRRTRTCSQGSPQVCPVGITGIGYGGTGPCDGKGARFTLCIIMQCYLTFCDRLKIFWASRE